MWSRIRGYLLTGLVAILPLVVTIWILYRIFLFIDTRLAAMVEPFNLTLSWLWMGKGLILVAILVFILLVGLFVRNIMGRRFLAWGEGFLNKMPLVRRIYPFVRQVSDALLGQQKRFFQRVVLVEYPRKGVYSLGFVTKEATPEIKKKTKKKMVTVFISTTPNPTSGVLMLFPLAETVSLEMSVEEGMKFLVSGGTVIPPLKKKRSGQ
jgi:uncharacterized membrane protein